jgi:hypothetical protein
VGTVYIGFRESQVASAYKAAGATQIYSVYRVGVLLERMTHNLDALIIDWSSLKFRPTNWYEEVRQYQVDRIQ